MSRIITFSEAGSIAIHAMVLIAKSNTIQNAQNISDATGTSRHHVAKVMQRLAKDGYVSSSRGPKGGFILKANPKSITLLEIYESIEGKIEVNDCMMEYPVCPFEKCLMGNIIKNMTKELRNYLGRNTLADYL